jgi:hypothetical protein
LPTSGATSTKREEAHDGSADGPSDVLHLRGGNRQYLRRRRTGREKVSLRGLLIGSAATMAGGLWLLAILGFVVPWFSIPPGLDDGW